MQMPGYAWLNPSAQHQVQSGPSLHHHNLRPTDLITPAVNEHTTLDDLVTGGALVARQPERTV